jgi:hypothetical protein
MNAAVVASKPSFKPLFRDGKERLSLENQEKSFFYTKTLTDVLRTVTGIEKENTSKNKKKMIEKKPEFTIPAFIHATNFNISPDEQKSKITSQKFLKKMLTALNDENRTNNVGPSSVFLSKLPVLDQNNIPSRDKKRNLLEKENAIFNDITTYRAMNKAVEDNRTTAMGVLKNNSKRKNWLPSEFSTVYPQKISSLDKEK